MVIFSQGGAAFQAFSDVQIDPNKPYLYQDICPHVPLSLLTLKSWLDQAAPATGDMAQGCMDTYLFWTRMVILVLKYV